MTNFGAEAPYVDAFLDHLRGRLLDAGEFPLQNRWSCSAAIGNPNLRGA
jgi:hypothetical protein